LLRDLIARLGVLAALLVAAAPAGASAASPKAADRALDTALHAVVAAKHGPPGVVAVVHRPGDRRLHRAGVARIGGRSIRIGDKMRLASAAKAFNGAVALALVKRHRLALGDTIGEILPSLPRRWHGVTLAQALRHTSGLPDFSASEGFQAHIHEHPTRSVRPRRLLKFVFHHKLAFRPGSAYKYSNSDNVVAALMAEAVTHRSYERNLRRLVYRPLKLTRTSLPSGPRMPRPFFHGYAIDGATGMIDDDTEVFAAGLAWASGGIVSTPADLDRFARGYVSGRLATPGLVRRQRRLVAGQSDPPGPGHTAAGMAIFRYRTRCGTVWGHTGNTVGYTQFFGATADGRRSVTVSASQQMARTIRPRLLRKLRHAEVLAVCAATAR
jgi:D-alanyl-D-alanine carboxypeptidase